MQTEHPDETSDSALDRISLIAAKDDFQESRFGLGRTMQNPGQWLGLGELEWQ
jgi:hypothetical protein